MRVSVCWAGRGFSRCSGACPRGHWPVKFAVGFVYFQAKGEPSCSPTVATNPWCGSRSASMPRWWATTTCACASTTVWARCACPVPCAFDDRGAAPARAPFGTLPWGGRGRRADLDDLLGLSVALRDAGADLSLVGTGHAARLRGAISAKHQSDVIDADVPARAAPSGYRSWRVGHRWQPGWAAADFVGPVGVSGRVGWVRRVDAHRLGRADQVAAPALVRLVEGGGQRGEVMRNSHPVDAPLRTNNDSQQAVFSRVRRAFAGHHT